MCCSGIVVVILYTYIENAQNGIETHNIHIQDVALAKKHDDQDSGNVLDG